MTPSPLWLLLPWSGTLLAVRRDLHTRTIPRGIVALAPVGWLVTGAWRTPEGIVAPLVLFGVLFAVWRMGGMGGGDVKLWLSIFAWTPGPAMWMGLAVAGGVLVATGAGQMLYRRRKSLPLRGRPTPAAWRVLGYLAYLTWVWT